MKETPGRLLVVGTPDEERGKTALLEGGHFQGADEGCSIVPTRRPMPIKAR